MRADTIEPGDMLADRDGALIYTVVDVLAPEYLPYHVATPSTQPHVVILVRYEVDGGTDTRTFAPEQDVPLTRPEPPSALAGSPTEAEVAAYDREQAERVSGLTPGGTCRA